MNVEKLKRVAIKEFKRSPAKTGFLLTMLPVALYFCVPLLFGAVKKSSPSTGAAAVAAVESASFVPPTATNVVVLPSWVEVSRSLMNDALAMPTGIPANARNPFAERKQEKKNEESLIAATDGEDVERAKTDAESAETVDNAVVASDPIRALGFRLTATMVGQRSRLATINGETYEEGETIPVSIERGMAADAVAALPVKLVHVDRRFVVLKIADHEHQLQLPNELPQDVIVVRSRPK